MMEEQIIQIKQKAEERAINLWGRDEAFVEERNNCIADYIAGATENGIEWHDLRKDPNDLPKGQINRYLFGYVKKYRSKMPMLISYNGEWFYDANTYNKEVKVIEWCEIPHFNSED